MKLFTATFFAATLLSLHVLQAQDANTVPLPPDSPAAPTAPNPAEAEPTPLPLIPDMPAPVEKPTYHGNSSGSTGSGRNNPAPVKKNKTAESIDDVADRIKLREAKIKALKDEKIQAEWDTAQTAKTDYEKRAALRRYYTLLYTKIIKIDGSLKKLATVRMAESIKQLDQNLVRPEEYTKQASATH